MMKIKKILLFSLLVLVLLGVSYATEANNDTTSTDTPEEVVVKDTSTTTSTVENSVKEETNPSNTKIVTNSNKVTKKKITNNKFNQTKKTATTYTVSTYTELVNQVENTDFSSDEVYTINLKKGNYTATKTINFEGNPETLIINGNGATLNGKNTYQFITLQSESTVIFNNICFVNYTGYCGGVIDGSYGTPIIINNSKFYNNKASSGGAIDSISLKVSNSIFSNNIAASGGAIECDGNTNITNTIFTNNRANSGITYPDYTDCGGAIENYGNLNIHNSSFTNNIAEKDGGAIYNYGTLNIKNSTFKENQGKNWKGGALYNCKDAFMDVSNNIFKQNQILSEDTGAIINLYGSITLKNNINDKTSNYYSTICNEGTAKITNNIFDDGLINTTLTINNIVNTQYNKNVTIKGKLLTENNILIKGANLTVQLNKNKYTVKTDNNGVFTLTVLAKTVGKNNVTVTYQRNKNYLPSNSKATFTVTKMTTKITINKINTTKYTNNATITGKVVTGTNNNLKGANLTVLVNGVKYTTKTNNQGTFTLKVKVKTVGTNNVTVKFIGNTNYAKSNSTKKFTVTKMTTKITVNKINATKYSNNATITGKVVTGANNNLKGANLTVLVNGVKYTTNTNNQGLFKLKVKAKTVGTNNVTVKFSGNNNYAKSNSTKSFKVVKQDLRIKINKISSVKKGRNATIKGTFTDANGVKIKSTTVKVKVGTVTYTAKTDSNGLFTLRVSAKTVGTNKVTVSFAGNARYNSVTNSTSFVVTN